MFDIIVSVAAKWWCKKHKLTYPDEESAVYLSYQKQALIYLMFEVLNKQKHTPLHMAAIGGARGLVEQMIQIPGVLVQQHQDTYSYDVTDLLPHTVIRHPVCAKKQDIMLDKPKVSLLEVITVQPLYIANKLVTILPLRQTIQDYWTLYQHIYFFLLMLHILNMVLFSVFSIPDIGYSQLTHTPNNTISSRYSPNAMYSAFLIWPSILLLYECYYVFCCIYKCAVRRDVLLHASGDSVPSLANVSGNRALGESPYCSTPSLPGTIATVSIYHMSHLASVGFAGLAISWFILHISNDSRQAYILAPCLLLGWLLTISFTNGFESVHNSIIMFKNIFINDVVRFTFFYTFILLGFTFAFEVLIQLSPIMKEDYPNTSTILYHTLSGLVHGGDLMVDDVDNKYPDHYHQAAVSYKLLYLTYTITTVMFVLCLLIAMIHDAYSDIKQKGEHYSAGSTASMQMAIRLEKTLPIVIKILTLCGIIRKYYLKFDADPICGSKRWIMKLTKTTKITTEDTVETRHMLIRVDNKLDEALCMMNSLSRRADCLEDKLNKQLNSEYAEEEWRDGNDSDRGAPGGNIEGDGDASPCGGNIGGDGDGGPHDGTIGACEDGGTERSQRNNLGATSSVDVEVEEDHINTYRDRMDLVHKMESLGLVMAELQSKINELLHVDEELEQQQANEVVASSDTLANIDEVHEEIENNESEGQENENNNEMNEENEDNTERREENEDNERRDVGENCVNSHAIVMNSEAVANDSQSSVSSDGTYSIHRIVTKAQDVNPEPEDGINPNDNRSKPNIDENTSDVNKTETNENVSDNISCIGGAVGGTIAPATSISTLGAESIPDDNADYDADSIEVNVDTAGGMPKISESREPLLSPDDTTLNRRRRRRWSRNLTADSLKWKTIETD